MTAAVCKVVDERGKCRAQVHSRGMCNRHYKRWRRDGDPTRPGRRGTGLSADWEPALLPFVSWGVRRRRWAESTVQGYCRRVRDFTAWCKAESIRPQHATVVEVRAYFDTLHPSVAVYTHARTALQAWFDFLVDTGALTASPMAQIRRYPVRRSLPRSLERDVAEAILDAARRHGPKWELYMGLMFFAGLRRAEACALEWSSVERDSEGGRWLRFTGKGGFERVVPVHDDLAAMLTRWRAECPQPRWVFPGRYPGEHMSVASATQWTRRIFDEAGCTEESGHAARHTYATRLIELGVDVPTVAEALGHLSLGSTTVYTRARPANVAAAVQGLDFKGGRS